MEESRPLKRVRQACDPCRRKKSRCPGERPICSFCQRLGQQCVYNDSDNDGQAAQQSQKMEQRMGVLESKMDRLIDQLLLPSANAAPSSGEPAARGLSPTSTEPPSVQCAQSPQVTDNRRRWSEEVNFGRANEGDLILDHASLRSVAQTYLTWCHSQPLVFFRKESFLDSLGSRDLSVLLAVQALGLRFPPRTPLPRERERLCAMSKASRRLAMESVFDSQVTLSTLQTLCLLSIVDFADGNPTLAETTIGIASSLVQGIPAHHTLGDVQEFNDCIRSIAMLRNLQGCVASGSFSSSQLNATDLTVGPRAARNSDHLPLSQIDQGILKYAFQLSEAWHMARIYAASVVNSDAAPPWSRQSDYSAVTQCHLEIDCQVPLKYRFSANKFSGMTPGQLHDQRHYYGPYIFLQIIYATIPCLLNHPFLLSLRLRNFRHTMPQAFIHQSFDLITRHAGWIMYFIDMIDKKSLQLSDPTLAHCAVIIATIHLQHSFVEDTILREKSQIGFDKCMKFLTNMGTVWSSVTIMAEKLRKLQNSVVMPPPRPSNVGDGVYRGERQSPSIDSKLLWNLLVYETAGRGDESPGKQCLFDSSLVKVSSPAGDPAIQEARAVEYDLVGSAGISGHKTVPKESPAYAPEDIATPKEPMIDLPWSFENRLMNGIDEDSTYEALLLQPNDFGRAIDEWMNFN